MVSGSPTLPDSPAGGGRLEPADAGLAGVQLKDEVTHLTPRGWYLFCKPVTPVLPRKNTPVPGAGMGTGSHGHARSPGTVMQPQESERSRFPSGSVTASPNSCVSHVGLWAGCNRMQDRKHLLKKLSEWDPSLLQARLAMEC